MAQSFAESFWRGANLAHQIESDKRAQQVAQQQAQIHQMQMAEYARGLEQEQRVRQMFQPVTTNAPVDPALAQQRASLGIEGSPPTGLQPSPSQATQMLQQGQYSQLAGELIRKGADPIKAMGIIPKEAQPKYDIFEKAGVQKYIQKGQSIPPGWRASKPSAVNIAIGGKPASASERTAIVGARASERSLNNLNYLFDANFVGPITGRAGTVKDIFGMNPQNQSEFNAATFAFKNQIIKQITGAQMSEPEAKRIMKQVPDVNDPPSVWKAKWKQSMNNVKFLQEEQLKILKESGLKVPGGITGTSNEELIRIIQGE